jgi:hypothetical protein
LETPIRLTSDSGFSDVVCLHRRAAIAFFARGLCRARAHHQRAPHRPYLGPVQQRSSCSASMVIVRVLSNFTVAYTYSGARAYTKRVVSDLLGGAVLLQTSRRIQYFQLGVYQPLPRPLPQSPPELNAPPLPPPQLPQKPLLSEPGWLLGLIHGDHPVDLIQTASIGLLNCIGMAKKDLQHPGFDHTLAMRISAKKSHLWIERGERRFLAHICELSCPGRSCRNSRETYM